MPNVSELKFCPRCAGALEVRAVGHPPSPHPSCAACGFVLWQNLKPSVEALIVRGHGAATEVLLGRRRMDSGETRWDLPGGFLNAGDRLYDALRRECLREMGVDVEVGDLLGVFEDVFAGSRIISIVYVCGVASGEPRGADIIDEARWFPIRDTPPAAYPAVAEALAALRLRVGP
ncbi:MAG: NUDIX domain-containing protein [Dehalococcoidia bacterium]